MNTQNQIPSSPRRPDEKGIRPQTVRPAARSVNSASKATPAHVKKTVSGKTASANRTVPAASRTKVSAAKANAAKPAASKKNAGSGRKIRVFCKKAGIAAVSLLRAAGVLLAFALGTVGAGFKWINRKLNVFRKNEAVAVIINCAFFTIFVSVLICTFLVMKPSMDASRAQKLADRGDAIEAARILEKLERKGYDKEELTKTKLTVVDRLIYEKEFSEARDILSTLPQTIETQALSDELDYDYAGSLYEKGEYSQAAQVFYQMQSYKDSLDRYYNCRCALAIQTYLDGQENQAQSLLAEIPNLSDRIQLVISGITAGTDEAVSARIREALSEDKIKEFEQRVVMTVAKESVQKGRIASGYRHTLGLKKDGTVYAAGDNSRGQTEVSDWKNVIQVAAGAYHSVALLEDGTVIAAGSNDENQIDVSGWTDIVSIAASGYDTIGLKADGSVVACGMHADLVSRWHGVTLVTGGAHSMGCLYDKGYMMATHAGAQMDMSAGMFDLSVCSNVSAGILNDGTLVTNIENAPEWSGIVSVEVSSTGIFAIDSNGKVRSYFYRPGDSINFDLASEAVEIASSGTHHVVLTRDGRVHSYGDNEFGQLDTGSWNLEEGQA